ncbi:hypothetical protein A3L25_007160 [Pseudomonas putida]|uniref:Uncharacterized protein n=1 Tax=Pseudomonas putida TaxID=303 RepID=A0AAP9MXC4_PSEPU|nr:glycosyltransferase [Pseudomonas putida]QJQ09213.1 hypothetical protein A3L25_007160 [Pseudomonas putida]
MKVITYWETAPGRAMPPYIALGIATMQLALGDSFLLLTNNNTRDFIGDEYLKKRWTFKANSKDPNPEITSIVAKSDYLRMAYVAEHGGFWIDADTIVFKDFTKAVSPSGELLSWHSEQFFGANPNNEILRSASQKALSDEIQVWGNPGGIKDLVLNNAEKIKPIPFNIINPGHQPTYGYGNCKILLDTELRVSDFLTNSEARMMKLYNTAFRSEDVGGMELAEFFKSNTLIAKIFLHLNNDPEFWIHQTAMIIKEHS